MKWFARECMLLRLSICRADQRQLQLEVDRSGKTVWEFTGSDHPELNFTNAGDLQTLTGGSILVTNFLRGNSGCEAHAFILTKEKKIAWTFTDHKNFGAASQVWAIG